VAFSNDLSIFVTVGVDAQRRVQIIAWDFQLLLLERGIVQLLTSTKKSNDKANNLVIAKQLSDFPINKIYFSPFEECGLVSCGRENVRFWRLKKGHMPGRPIMLNEYSRGYIFNEIVFLSEAGLTQKDPRKQVLFVSSSKGMLLKIDCEKEQVLCSYQLHSGSIMSLSLRNGFAVTGGEDSKLRVWPLDFSDFLLEAHHEASVTNIHIDNDGKKICVGTSFGTLGVLDVSEHSYCTILRSHVGKIIHISSSSNAEEFVTLGDDNTIRLWDASTAQQKFEFTSPSDPPLCATYHPVDGVLSCGFGSGSLRVFDIESTSTLVERKVHTASIVSILYNSHKIKDNFRLFTASLDGSIVVYDAVNDYEPIRENFSMSSISFCLLKFYTYLIIQYLIMLLFLLLLLFLFLLLL
jgi:WD40 repeat protein